MQQRIEEREQAQHAAKAQQVRIAAELPQRRDRQRDQQHIQSAFPDDAEYAPYRVRSQFRHRDGGGQRDGAGGQYPR